MPLLIYGADIPYDEEITLDRFVDVVDDSSWDEFMPDGVTKKKFKEFQKYYDEEVFIAAGRRIRNIAKRSWYLRSNWKGKKRFPVYLAVFKKSRQRNGINTMASGKICI